MSIIYVPPLGISGDVIPFYWDGEYHLFYIAPRPEPGAPWCHVSTRDFVEFNDTGEAIPCGPIDAQDLDIWTGSVIERDSEFHIFYTGHNGSYPAQGKPDQMVMHATSTDLISWVKDDGFAIPPALDQGYEMVAWRDPLVFWNADAGEYWMLVTARIASDIPVRRRGCVALLASIDLKDWELRDPLWSPELFDTHECPDLFKIGDWWYLVFSTYLGEWATHYRMSRSLAGPWIAPEVDTFDADGFYAAKTAGDGGRRFVIGWLANRNDKKDESAFAWGGSMLAHELEQQPDGTLTVRIPQEVASVFSHKIDMEPTEIMGSWKLSVDSYKAESIGRMSILSLGDLPETCLIETDVVTDKYTHTCGFLLRADEGFANYYQLLIEPDKQRIRFIRDGELPVQRYVNQEREVDMLAGESVRLKILIDGSAIVIYVNDKEALSGRMHDISNGKLGFFVGEGQAEFINVTIKCMCK